MVQYHFAFQDLGKKGMELGNVKDTQVTREEDKKTTQMGDSGMVMDGVRAEYQVEVTEEDTIMAKVGHQETLNKEEMEEVKVEGELHIAVKVVHMEADVVEVIGMAKAKVLEEITVIVEKETVVETVENKMNEMVDAAIKSKTEKGI